MTIMEMLGQSGILTFLGMGVVFIFLIIMIIVIGQTGKIINKNETKKVNIGSANQITLVSTGTDDNSSTTAAISAAINEYRKSQ